MSDQPVLILILSMYSFRYFSGAKKPIQKGANVAKRVVAKWVHEEYSKLQTAVNLLKDVLFDLPILEESIFNGWEK